MENDLAEVIGMSRPREKTDVTNCAVVSMLTFEKIFLYIRDCLHRKANGVQYYSGDISAGPKFGLIKLRYVRRVEHSDRERYAPNPKHLEIE